MPTSMAMIDVVAETGTPMIAFAPAAALTAPVDDKRRWIFKTMTSDDHELARVLTRPERTGQQTVAFIGFADPFGEQWLGTVQSLIAESG